MHQSSPEQIANILGALAHANRVRILEMLSEKVYCQCELGPALEIEQSNLSRHLKTLTRVGILTTWREGNCINFKIADREVLALVDLAASIARRTNVKSTTANKSSAALQMANDLS